MNIEQARQNMLKQQIRPWDVLDQQVLNIMQQVPREAFVPAAYRKLAFADTQLPLAHNQCMMQPALEARMLQALNIKHSDKVLEIGTGSSFITACLAKLAKNVESIDIYQDFVEEAETKLASCGLENVLLAVGDASKGWGEPRQYDVIAITASMPRLPDTYKQALAVNGRLFAIIGAQHQATMEALLITRTGEKQWIKQSLFETRMPTLINAASSSCFEF